MGGLARMCKTFGRMTVTANGKKEVWIYDYVNDKPRLESEMTKEEITASERKKWLTVKDSLKDI